MVRMRNKRNYFLGFEPLRILFPFPSYVLSLILAMLLVVWLCHPLYPLVLRWRRASDEPLTTPAIHLHPIRNVPLK